MAERRSPRCQRPQVGLTRYPDEVELRPRRSGRRKWPDRLPGRHDAMTKTVLPAGLLIVIILLLPPNCASAAPSITSPGDCLVVIKSDFVTNPYLSPKEQNSEVFQFNFSGDYSPAVITENYTMVVVRDSAISVKSVTCGANFGFRGQSVENKTDMVLPYKPGYIVFADFVFVKKPGRVGRTIVSNYYFRKITAMERRDLFEQFSNDSAFSEWKKFDDSIPAGLALPGMPTDLSAISATIAGGDSITISWNAVSGAASYVL